MNLALVEACKFHSHREVLDFFESEEWHELSKEQDRLKRMVHFRDSYDGVPLIFKSAERGELKTCEILFEQGADINAIPVLPVTGHKTPPTPLLAFLFHSTSHRYDSFESQADSIIRGLKFFLDNGAELNGVLHYASRYSPKAVVEYVLTRGGVDVNSLYEGFTTLGIALAGDRPQEILPLLLAVPEVNPGIVSRVTGLDLPGSSRERYPFETAIYDGYVNHYDRLPMRIVQKLYRNVISAHNLLLILRYVLLVRELPATHGRLCQIAVLCQSGFFYRLEGQDLEKLEDVFVKIMVHLYKLRKMFAVFEWVQPSALQEEEGLNGISTVEASSTANSTSRTGGSGAAAAAARSEASTEPSASDEQPDPLTDEQDLEYRTRVPFDTEYYFGPLSLSNFCLDISPFGTNYSFVKCFPLRTRLSILSLQHICRLSLRRHWLVDLGLEVSEIDRRVSGVLPFKLKDYILGTWSCVSTK